MYYDIKMNYFFYRLLNTKYLNNSNLMSGLFVSTTIMGSYYMCDKKRIKKEISDLYREYNNY